MRRTRALVTGILIAGLTASLAACSQGANDEAGADEGATEAALPEKYQEQGITVVTSDGTTPPYSFVAEDGDGEHEGFDPDLARAIGEELGVDVKFQALSFDGMIPGVVGGRFDLAMFGITDTKERQGQVDMIDYIAAGTSIIVKTGNPDDIQSLEDFCGKTVAVVSGGSQAQMALDQAEKCDMKVDQFPTKADAYLAIMNGRAQVSLDGTGAALYLAKHPSGVAEGLEPVQGVDLDVKPMGIVVSKKAPELRDAVVGALEHLRETGEYQKLLDKWELGDIAVDEITVNSGE